jgi:hypothetical protein
MNAVKVPAMVLIVGGILGLVYGGFSYTRETHEAKVGPIELSVKDKRTVNVLLVEGIRQVSGSTRRDTLRSLQGDESDASAATRPCAFLGT